MSPRLIGVALTLCLSGCVPIGSASEDREPPRAPVVRTATVEALPSHREVILRGVTRARQRGSLGFTVAGRLRARPVQVGEVVRAGDVLAELDLAGLRHARAAADGRVDDLASRLAQLERDRQRLEELGARQSATPAQVERIRAEERSVRANLEAARASAAEAARQLHEGVLRAPFGGVVSSVLVEPGEFVTPGAAVVELTGEGVEIELQVPERLWLALRPGDAASVRLPALDHTARGRVEIVSGATAPGGLFPVVVGLDEPLASGLTAEVAVQVPNGEGLAVPLRALVDPVGTGPTLYRLVEDAVERIPVTPGPLLGDRVAVTGPLDVGDEIVVAGHARLLDGDRVEVLR